MSDRIEAAGADRVSLASRAEPAAAALDHARVAPLQGRTIAITEARRAVELSTLITRLGGVPYSAPAVREIPRPDQGPALAALDRIVRGEVEMIVFLTGVGTRAFLALAAGAGRRDALLRALSTMTVVARGPKPTAALREAGVRIDAIPAEPTSEGVLAALAGSALRGTVVAVQLYGEDSPPVVDGLVARGADVVPIPLYEWALPEDEEALSRLARDLVAGRIDIVAFTSSPQVRNLFAIAERAGLAPDLRVALAGTVTVASIGPVCTATLAEHGVTVSIQPAKGTMGALVHAITTWGASTGPPSPPRSEHPGEPGALLDHPVHSQATGPPSPSPSPPHARSRPGEPGTALDDTTRSRAETTGEQSS